MKSTIGAKWRLIARSSVAVALGQIAAAVYPDAADFRLPASCHPDAAAWTNRQSPAEGLLD
ncbi:MAG: hypothetical protein PVH89_04890 [Gammaproteobacteria bacterium]